MIEKRESFSKVTNIPRSGVLAHTMASMAIAATMAVSPTVVEATGSPISTIENIQQANTAATNLANTYTQCRIAKTVLNIPSLLAAQQDFK